MVVETAAKPPGKAVKPDDSTVVISKMLSWLLRHGIKHKSVGLTSDSAEGWVKVNDVLTSDYFKDMTRDILMKVIVDSNAQKLRYQLTPDCVYIRAYSTHEKKAFKEGAASAAAAPAVPSPEKKGAAVTGTLRGEAPEFVPSANPLLPPMQTPGYPFLPYLPYAQPPAMPQFVPVMVQQKGASTGHVTRELGRIKSFYDDKGYGFIECPRVTQQFGRDLFVHKAQLNGFKVGDEVTLTVTVNESGMPQAQDLQSATGPPAPPKGKGKGKEKGKEKGKDKGEGKGKEGKGKGEGKAKDGKGKADGKGKSKDGKKKKKEEKMPEAAGED